MDYEQKYKQLHKFISDLYPFMSEYCKEKVEGFLPELKESEDERILEIIKHCIESRYLHTSTIKGISQKQCFAWLENLKDCEVIKKEWFEHIKKSWYKEGYIDGKYSGAKEWKKSDATILNELIDFLENGKPKLQHDLTLYANWLKKQFTPLEKQGEQSSLNINRECLKGIKRVQEYQDLSDWEKEFDKIASMYAHNKNQEGYNDSWYVKERAAEMLYYAKKELEKQGGQKPTDEVESITQSYIIPNEKFFQWIYDRLVHVHNENPNVDYMLSLKKRIEDMQNPINDDMIEALRTEYEKGRADVIADTLSWLDNCWPKYCSNHTIIEGFKEAIKY